MQAAQAERYQRIEVDFALSPPEKIAPTVCPSP